MPAVSDSQSLSTIPLFRGLTSDELNRINALLHRKTFPAGMSLFTAEQPGEVAYLIVSGTVKVAAEQADGSIVILAIRGPGEIVGELSLIDNAGRSASVSTLEESTLLWIDRVAFQACLQAIPPLAYNLLEILARRLRLASAQIQALATQDLYGRVARQLLALAEAYGQPAAADGTLIPLHLTQSDLAGLVGASRSRVNQVLESLLVCWQ
jgi:CRP/FNR family cyclic AMP-dependent transcriptional regulator